jgi:myo-inositol catabolism protein IolH
VKNWKRLVEIAVEMGVQVINTEFSGDPNQPEICDEMFYRSMEELLPIFEREGIRVEIQAHPWDFCEENNETVDIVKSFRSDNVKYVTACRTPFSTTKASATWRACCAMPGAISPMS